NIFSLHQSFNISTANNLFKTLVVSGDAHIQLATCSLLTLTKLLVPMSPKFNNQFAYTKSDSGEGTSQNFDDNKNNELWNKSDLN
uniref:Uncharacterized protein n=1 Tax=Megaselia scalaris TaxID=36166 RepID=T1GAL7_MEGSC